MGIQKRKICMLGTFGVGKTSLVERFVNNRFSEKYLTTVGLTVSQKMMPPVQQEPNGIPIQHMFLIWDIAAIEKFDSMVSNYFRGASGALAVVDLTRPETADELATILDRFFAVCPEAVVVYIANKVDLISDPSKINSRFDQLSVNAASELIVTSAKTGAQVEDAFYLLSQQIETP